MQGINGFDDGFARAVIVRSLVFIAVEIAYSATCFFASMFVRHLGGAIGLNLGLMLISDIAVQILFSFDWMIKYLNYIPAAQTMLVMGDISNENIARALVSSVVACALVVALSYLKFRREELK